MSLYHQSIYQLHLSQAIWLIAMGLSILCVLVGQRWHSTASLRLTFWGGLAIVVLLVGWVSTTHYVGPIEGFSKTDLHSIQISLERYAQKHQGLYPPTVDVLVDQGYMPSMPINEFTDKPMQDIPFGFNPWEGDFTYIPVAEGDRIIGYYLLGYGSQDTDAHDVNDDGVPDHVILAVMNGVSSNEGQKSLPTLADLLRGDHSENPDSSGSTSTAG